MFEAFERTVSHGTASRPVLAEFGVEGFISRHERHFVYWRRLTDGDTGIVTVLHERMHRIDRLREDFGLTREPPPDRG